MSREEEEEPFDHDVDNGVKAAASMIVGIGSIPDFLPLSLTLALFFFLCSREERRRSREGKSSSPLSSSLVSSPIPLRTLHPLVFSRYLPLDLATLRGSRRATPMSLHRSLSRSSTRTASAPFSYICAHSTALGSRPAYTFLLGGARRNSLKSGERFSARRVDHDRRRPTGASEERRTCFPRARRTGWTV